MGYVVSVTLRGSGGTEEGRGTVVWEGGEPPTTRRREVAEGEGPRGRRAGGKAAACLW